MGLAYYVIDVETTGLSSSYHEITELSVIRCTDRMQLTEMIKCDYPERANIDALQITNKTLTDLNQGKSKDFVVNKINKFLNEDNLTPAHRCFVAHNYSFDKKFVHALYEKVGQVFEGNLWLCTMALTKKYAKQMGIIKPKTNLHAALNLVGIKKFAAAHASKVDSRNTYLLWKHLIEEKKIDYLPFIKTAAHNYITPEAALAALDQDQIDPERLDVE
jgi:DNA polymerase III alpha subunit (gram-positive type)